MKFFIFEDWGFSRLPFAGTRMPALKFRQELHTKHFIFKQSELSDNMKVIFVFSLGNSHVSQAKPAVSKTPKHLKQNA